MQPAARLQIARELQKWMFLQQELRLPGRSDDEEPPRGKLRCQIGNHVHRRVVCPMDIVEKQNHRPALARCVEEGRQLAFQSFLSGGDNRRRIRRAVRRGGNEPEPRGREQLQRLRIFPGEIGERLEKWQIGFASRKPFGTSARGDRCTAGTAEQRETFFNESCFAEARFAGDADDRALFVAEDGEQFFLLIFASHEMAHRPALRRRLRGDCDMQQRAAKVGSRRSTKGIRCQHTQKQLVERRGQPGPYDRWTHRFRSEHRFQHARAAIGVKRMPAGDGLI